MKKYYLYGRALFAGLVLLSLGCQRSQVFGDVEPNTTRVVAEFTDARTGTSVTRDFAGDFIDVDLTELRLSPRTVTDHDTKVKIALKPGLLSDYNIENGTNYVEPVAGTFGLTTKELTLTPDHRKQIVRGVLQPSAFLDRTYAVGLTIAEVANGEISTVSHDVIVFISIKNSYDGIYSVKGYSNIPSTAYVGPFSLPCSEELGVATSSSNSVYLDPAQPVANAGSFSYITNLLPNIALDKTTNKVTAVTGRAGSLALIYPFDASYNSRYDPATKTIYVKYGIAPAGSGRYIIDTLSYCRPR
jgi:hypothetical protein